MRMSVSSENLHGSRSENGSGNFAFLLDEHAFPWRQHEFGGEKSTSAVPRIPRGPFVAHASRIAQCRTTLLLIRWRPHRFAGTDHGPYSDTLSGTRSGGFAEQVMTFASGRRWGDLWNRSRVRTRTQCRARRGLRSRGHSLYGEKRIVSNDSRAHVCVTVEQETLSARLRRWQAHNATRPLTPSWTPWLRRAGHLIVEMSRESRHVPKRKRPQARFRQSR